MATVAEAYRGESGDQNGRTIEFVVTGATDTGDAITSTSTYIATNYSGSAYDGFPLQNISSEEVSWTKGVFRTIANFGLFSRGNEIAPETSDIELSFDVNLDTRRVYRSIETVESYVPAGSAADKTRWSNQINVTEDGAEGADVRIPVGGFQVTFYAPVATVTPTYRATVLGMVGKVNNATFYGHAAGEVMFSGVAGRQRNSADWELTFRFEVSPNQTNIDIGGTITVTTIEGWDLLWVEYAKPAKDPVNDGHKIHRPLEAYVERIYERADFSQLGIETS